MTKEVCGKRRVFSAYKGKEVVKTVEKKVRKGELRIQSGLDQEFFELFE